MKDFSPITKIYLFSVMFLGLLLLGWNTQYLQQKDWLELFILVILGSTAMIIKVKGATERWHFSLNFLVYGFCMVGLGIIGTMLVILISNLVYWIWYRDEYKGQWYIIAFNIASFIVVSEIATLVYQFLNPIGGLEVWTSVIAILAAMAVFTLLNHLLVGIIVWLARGQNFIESGVFEFMPMVIDFTLLVMGASLNIVWQHNPLAVALFLLPLYLIYSTLRVPALERQTEIDQKTGVYNHGYFMGQLDHELARANRFDRPLTVILGDLDLLRNINNSYGHLAGDEVLIGIAKILKESVREYDIVARFGGEEFVILMPETDGATAFTRAEEIRKAIQMAEFTVPTSVTPIRATMSFGVASRDSANQAKEEILHNADIVLYHSKLRGRNRTHIYSASEYEILPKSVEIKQAVAVTPIEQQVGEPDEDTEKSYSAAYTTYQKPNPAQVPFDPPEQKGSSEPSEEEPEPLPIGKKGTRSEFHIFAFITSVVVISSILLAVIFRPLPENRLWGLLLFAAIVALTEWFSIDLYVRETAVSTSAAPLLAGVLLFGPVGALSLSIVFSLTAYLKSRGPFNRVFFNTGNQLLAATIYLGILKIWDIPYLEWGLVSQLLFSILAIIITFLVTTLLVSVGMSLNNWEDIPKIWKTQFSWLTPYYLVMGLMAYALIFGYVLANVVGVILFLTPLMMIRFSQAQYIERTKKIVIELRDKNLKLERSSNEIAEINNGLLDTLAEIIDLRDAYVLSHSRRVTGIAVQIAQRLGLTPRQVEIVRKASLLHDIGKIGVPDTILGKPATLTSDEFANIRRHPGLGASLLEKSASLKNLVPLVRHHHENYDGSGYPEGLSGSQIPLEARVVAVADAVEAMISDRPYRKARSTESVIAELKRCSGTQFDPDIVDITVKLLKSQKIF
jgi:diguanylate cyclase (GGDEF)-like protein/putative nucleotidyltransferase with HDIG domain